MRSLNTNNSGANLENVNSTSINFDSNQSDLPKYEDLIATQPGNGNTDQQVIELNDLQRSSIDVNTVNESQENNNTFFIETDLNLPKYTELNLK